MSIYKKGDWSYWEKYINQDTLEQKERFLRYTWKHKIRLWIGFYGQMPDGNYLYKRFKFLKYVL